MSEIISDTTERVPFISSGQHEYNIKMEDDREKEENGMTSIGSFRDFDCLPDLQVYFDISPATRSVSLVYHIFLHQEL